VEDTPLDTRHPAPLASDWPATLEQRRLVALETAHQCDRLLREQFSAAQVIVFGSLVEDSSWHWNSDLDLAVGGLSQADWIQACDAVQAIAPPWLKVDLTRLEQTYPEVKARILQQKEMTENLYLSLKSRLEDELVALERTSVALQSALQQVRDVPEDFAIRTLASYLNDFYRRCERMSERVAVTLDGELPQGQNWHQALLRQVADARGDRLALWSGSLLLDLDEYRKFRHVVHHRYGDELQIEYVVALAELAPGVAEKVKQAIAAFGDWLSHQS
jgi:predicted nucleotidyltransferase